MFTEDASHRKKNRLKRHNRFFKHRKHIYVPTKSHTTLSRDPINGHKNISFMKITRFVRTNTCFLYVLFVCNSTFFTHCPRGMPVFFFFKPTNNASMFMVKCAVYWLVSAISAWIKKRTTTKESFLHVTCVPIRNISSEAA